MRFYLIERVACSACRALADGTRRVRLIAAFFGERRFSGIAVSMLGIICSGHLGNRTHRCSEADADRFPSAYQLTFDGLVQRPGPNYPAVVGKFTARSRQTWRSGVMEPSKRSFTARAMKYQRGGL